MKKHRKVRTYSHDGYTMRNEFEIIGDVCWISLTQGQRTKIDISDITEVGRFRWSVRKHKGEVFRPTGRVRLSNGMLRETLMYRFILNCPNHLLVDHCNHDTLDNTRANIRKVTHSENQHNKRSQKNSSSSYLGVSLHMGKYWYSSMRIKGISTYIGSFKTPKEAGIAYAKRFVTEYGLELNLDMTKLAQGA